MRHLASGEGWGDGGRAALEFARVEWAHSVEALGLLGAAQQDGQPLAREVLVETTNADHQKQPARGSGGQRVGGGASLRRAGGQRQGWGLGGRRRGMLASRHEHRRRRGARRQGVGGLVARTPAGPGRRDADCRALLSPQRGLESAQTRAELLARGWAPVHLRCPQRVHWAGAHPWCTRSESFRRQRARGRGPAVTNRARDLSRSSLVA
mmetsp:Transcript_17730/g.41271  ORF Transcript_17730/g.41271 Transcript_17730/m.41271 type:complete len:209 (+) Transcript_17730:1928-2554(+)